MEFALRRAPWSKVSPGKSVAFASRDPPSLDKQSLIGFVSSHYRKMDGSLSDTNLTFLFRRLRRSRHTLQFAIRHDSTVNRQDPIDIDVQAPNVGFEVDRLRIGNFGRFRSLRTGSKDIGFDKNFFFAQINHDDAI